MQLLVSYIQQTGSTVVILQVYKLQVYKMADVKSNRKANTIIHFKYVKIAS